MANEIDNLDKQRLELIKFKMAMQSKLDTAFDANDLDSKPTGVQIEFLEDNESNVIFVVCANRCLAEGTLVATPKGPTPIESLKFGDVVYDENGKEIRVKALYNQGIQEVVDLTHRGIVQATSTLNHVWKVQSSSGVISEKALGKFNSKDKILRTEVTPSLGTKDVADAYTLGILLGDGCSKEKGNQVYMSSIDNAIPQAINTNAVKCGGNNYTYNLGYDKVEFYDEWCNNRYAHEKMIDLEEVKTWNRESVVKLLAGLIDSDGSIQYQSKYNLINFCISMQAKSCIEFVQWAMLALYQYNCNILLDDRSKYKNGPCHLVKIRNTHVNRRMSKEISPYMNTKKKKYNAAWDVADNPRFNPDKLGVVVGNKRKAQCFDIHVDSDTNLYLLANGLVTHNSGKTAAAARAVSWWLQNKHPYRPAKKKWGKFNILIVGRTTTILEEEIWEKKIRPFLRPGSYKVKNKSGGGIESVKDLNTGNKLIFMSHHDAKNAREKVQGFTAPIVWVDEMPDDSSLITELMVRTATEGGLFMATFTPLVENEHVRKIVDAKAEGTCKYHFLPEDNPRILEEFDTIERYSEWLEARCASKAEYRARRFGEWYYRSGRVIRAYNPDTHDLPTPPHYDARRWPHVSIVDPSASGLTGLSVWAWDDIYNRWICVKAKKMEGDAAYILVQDVEKEIAGLNIIKRLCDCNPAGFYKEAIRQGIVYEIMNDKNDRKNFTIENTNDRFAKNVLFLTPEAQELAEECLNAKWSETNPDKMINASSYHLIDTMRYFVDRMPNLSDVQKDMVSYSSTYHMAKQEHVKYVAKRGERKALQIKAKRDKMMKIGRRKSNKFGRR